LSLTLREEHRVRVFENRVLRRIFGPKRDDVTGGCSVVYLSTCYSSVDEMPHEGNSPVLIVAPGGTAGDLDG
jgi:hypothetical protein